MPMCCAIAARQCRKHFHEDNMAESNLKVMSYCSVQNLIREKKSCYCVTNHNCSYSEREHSHGQDILPSKMCEKLKELTRNLQTGMAVSPNGNEERATAMSGLPFIHTERCLTSSLLDSRDHRVKCLAEKHSSALCTFRFYHRDCTTLVLQEISPSADGYVVKGIDSLTSLTSTLSEPQTKLEESLCSLFISPPPLDEQELSSPEFDRHVLPEVLVSSSRNVSPHFCSEDKPIPLSESELFFEEIASSASESQTDCSDIALSPTLKPPEPVTEDADSSLSETQFLGEKFCSEAESDMICQKCTTYSKPCIQRLCIDSLSRYPIVYCCKCNKAAEESIFKPYEFQNHNENKRVTGKLSRSDGRENENSSPMKENVTGLDHNLIASNSFLSRSPKLSPNKDLLNRNTRLKKKAEFTEVVKQFFALNHNRGEITSQSVSCREPSPKLSGRCQTVGTVHWSSDDLPYCQSWPSIVAPNSTGISFLRNLNSNHDVKSVVSVGTQTEAHETGQVPTLLEADEQALTEDNQRNCEPPQLQTSLSGGFTSLPEFHQFRCPCVQHFCMNQTAACRESEKNEIKRIQANESDSAKQNLCSSATSFVKQQNHCASDEGHPLRQFWQKTMSSLGRISQTDVSEENSDGAFFQQEETSPLAQTSSSQELENNLRLASKAAIYNMTSNVQNIPRSGLKWPKEGLGAGSRSKLQHRKERSECKTNDRRLSGQRLSKTQSNLVPSMLLPCNNLLLPKLSTPEGKVCTKLRTSSPRFRNDVVYKTSLDRTSSTTSLLQAKRQIEVQNHPVCCRDKRNRSRSPFQNGANATWDDCRRPDLSDYRLSAYRRSAWTRRWMNLSNNEGSMQSNKSIFDRSADDSRHEYSNAIDRICNQPSMTSLQEAELLGEEEMLQTQWPMTTWPYDLEEEEMSLNDENPVPKKDRDTCEFCFKRENEEDFMQAESNSAELEARNVVENIRVVREPHLCITDKAVISEKSRSKRNPTPISHGMTSELKYNTAPPPANSSQVSNEKANSLQNTNDDIPDDPDAENNANFAVEQTSGSGQTLPKTSSLPIFSFHTPVFLQPDTPLMLGAGFSPNSFCSGLKDGKMATQKTSSGLSAHAAKAVSAGPKPSHRIKTSFGRKKAYIGPFSGVGSNGQALENKAQKCSVNVSRILHRPRSGQYRHLAENDGNSSAGRPRSRKARFQIEPEYPGQNGQPGRCQQRRKEKQTAVSSKIEKNTDRFYHKARQLLSQICYLKSKEERIFRAGIRFQRLRLQLQEEHSMLFAKAKLRSRVTSAAVSADASTSNTASQSERGGRSCSRRKSGRETKKKKTRRYKRPTQSQTSVGGQTHYSNDADEQQPSTSQWRPNRKSAQRRPRRPRKRSTQAYGRADTEEDGKTEENNCRSVYTSSTTASGKKTRESFISQDDEKEDNEGDDEDCDDDESRSSKTRSNDESYSDESSQTKSSTNKSKKHGKKNGNGNPESRDDDSNDPRVSGFYRQI